MYVLKLLLEIPLTVTTRTTSIYWQINRNGHDWRLCALSNSTVNRRRLLLLTVVIRMKVNQILGGTSGCPFQVKHFVSDKRTSRLTGSDFKCGFSAIKLKNFAWNFGFVISLRTFFLSVYGNFSHVIIRERTSMHWKRYSASTGGRLFTDAKTRNAFYPIE